jgi:effector-binding domain-containing protein
MQRIGWLLLSFLVAGAIWLVVPLFFPETMVVRQLVTIEAPARKVFVQVNDFRNWEYWSPWKPREASLLPSYISKGTGRGGVIQWQLQGAENYRQRFTITSSEPHQFIEVATDFTGKFFAVNRIDLTENDGVTVLSWSMGWKTEGWKSLFDRFKQKSAVKNALTNLRLMAEMWHRQDIPVVEYGVINEFPYVSIRRQISWNNVSREMGDIFDLLIHSADEAGYTIIGNPYAVYHSMGDEKVDLECGFPIQDVVPHYGIIYSGIFGKVHCAITQHRGDYENLELGHEAIQQWINEREFSIAGPPMELFIIGDAGSDDPSSWLTTICYPVE